MLALEGITILDLTRGGPGPFHTMILGDLGAEVIRVEAPPTAGKKEAGIQTLIAEEGGGKGARYQAINRNKRSITLNLRSDKGREIFYELANKADVISEGFRPGVVKRLKVDYETIKKINPRIIYCSITGYGGDGPYADLPGHDANYISIAGALNLIGEKGRPPAIPLNLVADFGAGGMGAVIGVLSALVARNTTGKGQYVDIALLDTVIMLLVPWVSNYFAHNQVYQRGEIFQGGAYPFYGIYETKDGKFVTIGCLEPWFWENLCKAIGREDLAVSHVEPKHFLVGPQEKKWRDISNILKQTFLTKTRDEWFELLFQKNIPIGKVLSLDEVFKDPQVLHRNMVIEVENPTGEDKIKQIGVSIKLSDTPGKVRRLPPLIGEHTDEILTGLGYNKKQISGLRQEGIIS